MFCMMACETATEFLRAEKTELPKEAGEGMCLGTQGCTPTVWQPLSWAELNFSLGHRHQTSCCTWVHSFRFYTNTWGLEFRMLGDWGPNPNLWQPKVIDSNELLIWLKSLHLFSRIFSIVREAFGKWLRGNHNGENHACFPLLQLFPNPIFNLHSAYFQQFPLVCNSSGLAAALCAVHFKKEGDRSTGMFPRKQINCFGVTDLESGLVILWKTSIPDYFHSSRPTHICASPPLRV